MIVMIRPLSRRKALSALTGFVSLLTSCSAKDAREWKLGRISANGVDLPIPANTNVTIIFDGKGTAKGSSGVNSFVGGYSQDAGTLHWTSQFRSTRRGGPKEHMEFEHAFLSVLQACDAITEEKVLTLSGSKGRLVFETTTK